jgi:hypothetical protein
LPKDGRRRELRGNPKLTLCPFALSGLHDSVFVSALEAGTERTKAIKMPKHEETNLFK